MNSMTQTLSLHDITKDFGGGPVLAGITLDITPGDLVAIMGPSGSGKSTLMHCLAGLDAASGGSVQVGGTELTSLNDKQITQLRRDRIGFVFQSFNLLPMLTAQENILLPLELAGRKADQQGSCEPDGGAGKRYLEHEGLSGQR